MNTTEMVQIALDLAQLQELPLDSSVSVPGENITRVLAGIDMGAAELTLARQLGYDCVARHHNMVPRLGKLGELVAQSHYEKLVHYGVPVNVAQKLLEHRKRATEIMFHGSNLDGGPVCGPAAGDAISGPAHPRRPAGRADGGGEGGRGL